jgi:hypothetical protein
VVTGSQVLLDQLREGLQKVLGLNLKLRIIIVYFVVFNCGPG